MCNSINSLIINAMYLSNFINLITFYYLLLFSLYLTNTNIYLFLLFSKKAFCLIIISNFVISKKIK